MLTLVGKAAEGAVHEATVAGAREQLEQRQRDSSGAVRIAAEVFLLLRSEGRHGRPGPSIVVAMGVRQKVLAEATRFIEITIVTKPPIDGAQSGDGASRAADDVERHRTDLFAARSIGET